MSWLSKILGLDAHPAELQQINLDLKNLGEQVATGVITKDLGPVAGPIVTIAATDLINNPTQAGVQQATVVLQQSEVTLLETTAYAVARKLGLPETVTEADFDAEANAALSLIGFIKAPATT